MEYLEGKENEEYRNKASKLLKSFDDQITKLKENTLIENIRKEIGNKDKKCFSDTIHKLQELMTTNLPTCALIVDEIFHEQCLNSLQVLELMHLRFQVAMSLESFPSARKLADRAHELVSSLYKSNESCREKGCISDTEFTSQDIYRAYFQATFDCFLICRYQGYLKEAQDFLKELNDAAKEKGDFNDHCKVQIFYADWLLAKGLLNDAINNVLQPLLKSEYLSKENRGLLLQKLGNACRSAAQWGAAKEHLRESIQVARDLGDEIAEHDRITDLGNVYRSEGRIADALKNQIVHLAFALQRGDLHGLTVACFNTGFSYYSISPEPDLERALVFLVAQHDLAAQMENKFLQGIALNNIGKTFCALGLDESAIPVFKKCLSIAILTGNKGGEGMANGNLGTACRSLGKLDEAIVYHNNYLVNAQERGDTGGMAIMQRELAWDYLLKGDLQSAKKQVIDAIFTLESIRKTLGTEDSSRLANFDKNQAEAYNLLQVCLSKLGKVGESLALSEFGRARAITDIVRDRHLKTVPSSVQSSWLWKDDAIFDENIDTYFSKEILQGFEDASEQLNTSFLVYSVLKDCDSKGTQEKWLYIWLFLCHSHLKKEHNGKRVHLRKIRLSEHMNRAKLLDDAAFFSSLSRTFHLRNVGSNLDEVEPVSEDESNTDQASSKFKYSAIKMPNTESVKHLMMLLQSLNLVECEQDASDTKSTIETAGENCGPSFLSNIFLTPKLLQRNQRDTQHVEGRAHLLSTWKIDGQEQLNVLYEICIAPVEDLLPDKQNGDLPRITIIPQEFLFNIPFAALQNKDGQCFIEKCIISYAPSLRALRLLHLRLNQQRLNQRDKKLEVLAVGNPVMVFPKLHPLKYAEKEIELIKEIFKDAGNCITASQEDATKNLVLSSLSNKDILHIATHAIPNDPKNKPVSKSGDYLMRGCIVLAPSGKTCDGLLLATEIEQKSCSCQLITLSCCETGLGKLTGDGVLGLYRAFLAAGATGLVVTLWKITDDFAPKFMKLFYEAFLRHGEDAAKALHEAMIQCIKEGFNPSQWAAFSFIGATAAR